MFENTIIKSLPLPHSERRLYPVSFLSNKDLQRHTFFFSRSRPTPMPKTIKSVYGKLAYNKIYILGTNVKNEEVVIGTTFDFLIYLIHNYSIFDHQSCK